MKTLRNRVLPWSTHIFLVGWTSVSNFTQPQPYLLHALVLWVMTHYPFTSVAGVLLIYVTNWYFYVSIFWCLVNFFLRFLLWYAVFDFKMHRYLRSYLEVWRMFLRCKIRNLFLFNISLGQDRRINFLCKWIESFSWNAAIWRLCFRSWQLLFVFNFFPGGGVSVNRGKDDGFARPVHLVITLEDQVRINHFTFKIYYPVYFIHAVVFVSVVVPRLFTPEYLLRIPFFKLDVIRRAILRYLLFCPKINFLSIFFTFTVQAKSFSALLLN